VWKGWTTLEHADAYERLLREQVIPGLRQIKGHQAAYVLRENGSEEAEFMVVNFFESLDAVRAFAGEDYPVPVFEPEARQLLSKVEPEAHHYEVRVIAGDVSAKN
jgi:heme-degrading monooxygenase HmoA